MSLFGPRLDASEVLTAAHQVLVDAERLAIPAVQVWTPADLVFRARLTSLVDLGSFRCERHRVGWRVSAARQITIDHVTLEQDLVDAVVHVGAHALGIWFHLDDEPVSVAALREAGVSTLTIDLRTWLKLSALDTEELRTAVLTEPGNRTWLLNMHAEALRARALALSQPRVVDEQGRVACPLGDGREVKLSRCRTCWYVAGGSRDVLDPEPGVLCLGHVKVSGWRDLPPEEA